MSSERSTLTTAINHPVTGLVLEVEESTVRPFTHAPSQIRCVTASVSGKTGETFPAANTEELEL